MASLVETDSTVDPELTEDYALALLSKSDLPLETIKQIIKNSSAMKSRKVKLAIVRHHNTPRHLLLPILRHLFTFDLMRVALTPGIAPDIKLAAEESLIHCVEKLSLGEKYSLARRASGRVAAALLHDEEPRVIEAALQNSRLTESTVIKQLIGNKASAQLIQAIAAHPKWNLRAEIRSVLAKRGTVGTAAPGCPAEPSSAESNAKLTEPVASAKVESAAELRSTGQPGAAVLT